MELNVDLSREQIERLIEDPETELVVYYPDGTRVIVRLLTHEVEESRTVH
jgi:hypothetical protein